MACHLVTGRMVKFLTRGFGSMVCAIPFGFPLSRCRRLARLQGGEERPSFCLTPFLLNMSAKWMAAWRGGWVERWIRTEGSEGDAETFVHWESSSHLLPSAHLHIQPPLGLANENSNPPVFSTPSPSPHYLPGPLH